MGRVTARLRAIATTDPDCLEAFATLGWLYSERGAYRLALNWYERAVRHALHAVPESFSGAIGWNFPDNRPFLRCHHGLACAFMHLGDWPRCVALFEQHLKWNPDDSLRVRWLLGDAYVRAFRHEDAERQLKQVSAEYPPAHYSLAWMYFNRDRYAEALTELRKGFLENVYIAELILGAISPTKHHYWHWSNLAQPELARDHYQLFIRSKWSAAEKEFVAWAFDSADGLAERAAFRKHQEALSFERDIEERSKDLDQLAGLLSEIHAESSALWIRRVTSRRNGEHWVWEREAYE